MPKTKLAGHEEPYRPVFGETNTYDREKLYKEVWSEPVSSVAPKYGVTDVALRKMCKKLNVPLPPRGYWAKKQAGHKVEKPPLPETDGDSYAFGARTYHGTKKVRTKENPLDFLTAKEQGVVIDVIEYIESLAYHPLHPKIQDYIKEIKENQRERNTYFHNHFGDISEAQLSRAYRVVSTFFYAVEQSDGQINHDMALQILGQRIVFEIHEMQDVVHHTPTEDELRQRQLYEKSQKEGSRYPEPRIPKHDYIYNGRLRMCINGYRHYRDSQKSKLEDLLGELLMDAFQAADDKRKRAAFEKVNKSVAETEIDSISRYNEEVDRVRTLVNMADDFDIAQKIRAYICAVESQPSLSEDQIKWIEWAKRKADWFDPTISRIDDVLGVREHSSESKDKIPKHK